jgi:hypothetical protein
MRNPFERKSRQVAGQRIGWPKSIIVLLLALPFGVTQVLAQETIRSSLSRIPFTEYQVGKQPVFVTLGPFRGTIFLGLGVTFDDNADLSSTNAKSELRFNQSLGADVKWELSHLNEIDLRLGGTVSEVIGGTSSRALQVAIEPDSRIEFKLVAGDFLIRFHDYFSIVQDPTQDAGASNTNSLNRLTNDAGVLVDWYLSKLILTAGLDYTYSMDDSSGGNGNNNNNLNGSRSTLRPRLAAAYALTPTMNTGLEAVYNQTLSSSGSSGGDVNGAAFGPFLRGKLTRLITLDLAAGLYDLNGGNIKSIDYYLSFNISHQINRYFQYIASFNRDLNFSTGTDVYKENRFALGFRYLLRRNLTLSADGFVGPGRVFSGANPGNFTQYGADVGFGYRLSRRISASIGYQFVLRDADLGNYQRNLVNLSVEYAF